MIHYQVPDMVPPGICISLLPGVSFPCAPRRHNARSQAAARQGEARQGKAAVCVFTQVGFYCRVLSQEIMQITQLLLLAVISVGGTPYAEIVVTSGGHLEIKAGVTINVGARAPLAPSQAPSALYPPPGFM